MLKTLHPLAGLLGQHEIEVLQRSLEGKVTEIQQLQRRISDLEKEKQTELVKLRLDVRNCLHLIQVIMDYVPLYQVLCFVYECKNIVMYCICSMTLGYFSYRRLHICNPVHTLCLPVPSVMTSLERYQCQPSRPRLTHTYIPAHCSSVVEITEYEARKRKGNLQFEADHS